MRLSSTTSRARPAHKIVLRAYARVQVASADGPVGHDLEVYKQQARELVKKLVNERGPTRMSIESGDYIFKCVRRLPPLFVCALGRVCALRSERCLHARLRHTSACVSALHTGIARAASCEWCGARLRGCSGRSARAAPNSNTHAGHPLAVARCRSYVIEDGVCFLALSERAYPKKLVYSYLADVHAAFVEELRAEKGDAWPSAVATASRAYFFLRFGASGRGHRAGTLKLEGSDPLRVVEG